MITSSSQTDFRAHCLLSSRYQRLLPWGKTIGAWSCPVTATPHTHFHDVKLIKHKYKCTVKQATRVKYYNKWYTQPPKLSYVYWTVYRLDSWIKIDQIDVTCFIISLFTVQHVSNVSTSIFRSLRLIVDLFHVLYCSGSMCVGVTVWFGWGGVVSLCRLKHVVLQPA